MNCLPDVSALLNSNNHANFSIQTMFNKKTGISPIFCQNLLCKIFFFTIYPYSISFKNYLRGYVRQNFVNFLIKTLQDAKY